MDQLNRSRDVWITQSGEAACIDVGKPEPKGLCEEGIGDARQDCRTAGGGGLCR